MNIVLLSEAHVLPSNVRVAWTGRFRGNDLAGRHAELGAPPAGRRSERTRFAPRPAKASACGWSVGGAPRAAVMLHLRARYVSKAAILTMPIQPVSVENRSPA